MYKASLVEKKCFIYHEISQLPAHEYEIREGAGASCDR